VSKDYRLGERDAKKLRIVMIVLATGIFAGAASMRILDALLPDIAIFYGESIGTSGAAVTAYALSYSCCQLFYGPMGDRVGPYRIITLAAILSAVAALGCALAPTLDWLVALRFLAGGVAAAIGPLTLAWISHATDVDERPMVVANMTGASIIGTTAGQVGGGMIGAYLSWQASFIFIGILFAVAGLTMAHFGMRYPEFREIGRHNQELKGKRVVGLLGLLRRPSVRLVLAGVGLEGLAMYMSFTYISALLNVRFDLDMATIAFMVSLFGMGGIFFVLAARRFVRNISESRRAMIGGCMAGIGFLLLMLGDSIWLAGLALLILGLGFFMLHNILQVWATQMAPDAAGAAVSLFAATFFFAQAVGVMIGGWMFDHVGGEISFGLSAVLLSGLGLILGGVDMKKHRGNTTA
jgi:predicted MFS family arabinose efflux permease